jgi:parallel beta-helix repeat protein
VSKPSAPFAGAAALLLVCGLLIAGSDVRASAAACTGVPVTPATPSIQALINARPTGTTFCFVAGVFTNAATLRPRAGDVFDGAARQAVLDGAYARTFAFYGDATTPGPANVTIRGFVIQNYATPLQRGAIQDYNGRNWVIQDNDIERNAAAAVATGDGVQVLGNVLSHNGQEGFSAHGAGGRYESNTISGNNAALTCDRVNGCWARWEAGGGKAWNTTTLRLVDNTVDSNGGPGIWIDTNNVGTVIENNRVRGNWAAGIEEEISYNFIIRGNDVENNGGAGAVAGGERSGWAWDAGINVRRSQGLAGFTSLIVGNTVVGNFNGITLVDSPSDGCRGPGEGRYGPCRMANVLVSDNAVTMSQGAVGAYDDGPSGAIFKVSTHVRFAANHYVVATANPPDGDPSYGWFAWAEPWPAWSQWQADGNDVSGTLTIISSS